MRLTHCRCADCARDTRDAWDAFSACLEVAIASGYVGLLVWALVGQRGATAVVTMAALVGLRWATR